MTIATQAFAARRLDIATIVLEAAGNQGSSVFNGYYTWPRYGFDAELTAAELRQIPRELGIATTIADLMVSEPGRAWWRARGSGRYMEGAIESGGRSPSPSRGGLGWGWV